MIKGVLLTHGNLGRELITVAERILEEKIDLECISFNWESDGSDMMERLQKFVNVNRAHPIIIFTDMFGGSPSNISIKHIGPKVEVISGINLPGILKFACYQNKEMPFKELVKKVHQGILDGISVISEYLGEKRHD